MWSTKRRRTPIEGYQSLGAGCSLREREGPAAAAARDVGDASDDAFRPATSARSYELIVAYPQRAVRHRDRSYRRDELEE
jgi:hypothetical protein